MGRLQGSSERFVLMIECAVFVDSAAGDAAAVEDALASVDTTQFTATLNEELVKANATSIEVQVQSFSPPVLEQYVTSTTLLSTTSVSTTTDEVAVGSPVVASAS